MSLAHFTLAFLGVIAMIPVVAVVFVAWMYGLVIWANERAGVLGMLAYLVVTAYTVGAIGVLTS